MLASMQSASHGPHSKPGDVEVELKLGLAHWFGEKIGQVVIGRHEKEVDEAQLLLIPPEVEVLGNGARRAGEADVTSVADHDSLVVLVNRGGLME
jgi:hypothetical protein